MPENETDPHADAKSKMREALERKREQEHSNEEGRRNTGAVHGSQLAPGEGRREFRRKSG